MLALCNVIENGYWFCYNKIVNFRTFGKMSSLSEFVQYTHTNISHHVNSDLVLSNYL